MEHSFEASSERPKRHTFFILLILIAILFGGFWYYRVSHTTSEPTPTPNPSVSKTSTPSESIGDLQAAVINSAIPDYSSQF